jgi:hypothetical protein
MNPPTKPGPMARKVAAAMKSQREKIIGLAAVRAGIDAAAQPAAEALQVYAQVHSAALAIFEHVQDHPELRKLVGKIQKAQLEYAPTGPPKSPLTGPFFWAWALWDLGVGAPQETFGSMVVALCEAMAMPASFMRVLQSLSDSRLGVLGHTGHDGDHLLLSEPPIGVEHRCACGSGYRGERGQMVLARVLPPLFEGGPAVLWGTPYQLVWPSGADWVAYFKRTLPKTGLDGSAAYERLMKRGLSPRYWMEFIFEAYANHADGVVYLHGLPDLERTHPHSAPNANLSPEEISKAGRAALDALSPTVREISETLLDFAAPVLKDLPVKATPAQMKAALKLPWMVWNAMVIDDADGGGSKRLDEVRRTLSKLPAALEMLEELAARRRSAFAADQRMVGELTITQSDDGKLTVSAEARLPKAMPT